MSVAKWREFLKSQLDGGEEVNVFLFSPENILPCHVGTLPDTALTIELIEFVEQLGYRLLDCHLGDDGWRVAGVPVGK